MLLRREVVPSLDFGGLTRWRHFDHVLSVEAMIPMIASHAVEKVGILAAQSGIANPVTVLKYPVSKTAPRIERAGIEGEERCEVVVSLCV
jgi:hypothetical protein